MKDLGYGKDYAYDHNEDDGFSGQNYFPDGMERQVFYRPKGEGAEARMKERLDRWAALRDSKSPK
jgi:putative ATPase